MFDRQDTKAIKGLAVVMMLLHHLETFSDRYPVGFEGFKPKWEKFLTDGWLGSLAMNVRLCVAVFFFLGGYGLYKRWAAGKFSLFDSVMGLYKKYWKVFVVFVPIAYAFFKREGDDINGLAKRYNIVDPRSFISTVIANFLGLSDSINSEWWFINTYVCALFLGTVFCVLMQKNKHFAVELFAIFMIDILIRNFFPSLPGIEGLGSLNDNFYYTHLLKLSSTAGSFFMGVSFAKFDCLARLKQKMAAIPCRTLLGLIGGAAVIWCRSYIMGDLLDIVYSATFVVFASVFLDGLKWLKIAFAYLGKHSTNIWLIHSFYCYYFLEATHIVYLTSSVWVDLLILLAMSLASSIVLEYFFSSIVRLANYIKQFIPKNLFS